MESFDPIEYLTSKGLRGRRAGKEVVYPCFMSCGEEPGSRKQKWSINPTTGMWHCFVCDAAGGPYLLMEFFGDEPSKAPTTVAFTSEILGVAARVASQMLMNNDEALLYLFGEKRGLEPATVEERQLGFVPQRWSLSGSLSGYSRQQLTDAGLITASGNEFFSNSIVIPYIRNGRVAQLRAKHLGGKYQTMSGDAVNVFNRDRATDAKEILLVEGEFDAMAVEQVLKGGSQRWQDLAVLALPGATTWPEAMDKLVSKASRVYIGSDPDETGRRAADKWQTRIGSRARIIEWPQRLLDQAAEDGFELKDVDWSTWIGKYQPSWEEIAALIKSSSGRRLFSIPDVLTQWSNRPKSGLKMGFSELDGWLHPGVQPGQVVIILARTSTGKTVFLCNLAYNMRKRRIIFVSLEMTAVEIYERLARIYRFYWKNATDAEVAEAYDNVMICDENRLSEKDLAALVDEYVEERGARPEAIFVDYLGYYARGFKGDAYERSTSAVMQLKAEAKSHKVAIFTPAQVNRKATAGKPVDMADARDSVAGETWITLANGERSRIVDLVETQPKLAVLGPDYRYTTRRADRVWRKVERELFRVTTRSGRHVRVTAEHPFLTIDGWVKASELAPGSDIAIPARLPFGDQDLAHAELLGHLLAEAYLCASPVTYTEGDDSIREHVAQLAQRLGVGCYTKKDEPRTIVFPYSATGRTFNPLTEYLREQGMWGITSSDQVIPRAVWTAKKSDVAAFLRGLISSNGSAMNRGLSYSSVSEELVRGIQALLVRFGIHSYIRRELSDPGYCPGQPYWRLVVRESRALMLFANEIGLVGVKGERLMEWAVERRPQGGALDSLPATIWPHLHRIRKQRGLSWRQAFGGSGVDERRRLSITRAREIAERLADPTLLSLTNGDIRFESIASIEDAGRDWVYDISVVGLHNFVANEITVKNSGAVEETADFLMSLFRPDDGLNVEKSQSFIFRLGLLKSRHGNQGKIQSIRGTPMSLAMVDKDNTYLTRINQEIHAYESGLNYEQFRAKQSEQLKLTEDG